MSTASTAEGATALFVGDDLALDFINTKYGVDDGRRDLLTSDAAVIDWLVQ
uniref:ABATE domain-containing protein n=1 Tax=Burkholderia sp. Ac-20379 TaxID=2703900 RepID=UPI00197FBFC0